MKKKIITIILLIIVSTLAITTTIILMKPKKEKPEEKKDPKKYEENTFNLNLIKTVNSTQTNNYLISPYSIEMALDMLKEGANGTTKEEINKVLENRMISKLQVKDRVESANALFIRDRYKNSITQSFSDTIKSKYQGEVLYDKFTTPNVINDWVKKNTHDMIDKVVDKIDDDFVLGIANAIAIDVEWQQEFECYNTEKKDFIKENNEKMKTEMMYEYIESSASYFETEKGKGIILPYKKYNDKGEVDYEGNNQLEFIGILPNETVNQYIEKLTKEELETIDSKKEEAGDELHIKLSLPRFTYDFELQELKSILKTMGIQEVFNIDKADLTNMMSKEEITKQNIDNLYVSEAIHKTHIELNEIGTKAAAVTYFGVDKSSAMIGKKPKEITMIFDKPFIYLIRDVKTKELLFFGVVREPNEWKKSTCKD